MHNKQGFTLIELLIALSIVAVLALVAVPTYFTYSERAYFTEVVQATAPYKLAVEACYEIQNESSTALANCNPGSYGIPANAGASGNVASVTVASGIITGTGGGTHNISGVTIILTPTPTNNILIWSKTGTCVTGGLC